MMGVQGGVWVRVVSAGETPQGPIGQCPALDPGRTMTNWVLLITLPAPALP